MRVQFLRRASRQLQLQLEWWEENRPDAPNMMQVELRRMLKLLKSTPCMGVEARDVADARCAARLSLDGAHSLLPRQREGRVC